MKMNSTLTPMTGESKVTLQGFILVPDADLAIVQDELVHHTKLTMEEAGC